MDRLEERMFQLRREIRIASAAGEHARVRSLRAELRQAERSWEEAINPPPAPPAPVREHVHQALTLLGVPAAAKMIVAVDQSFFSGTITNAKLTSLRRDEERSFRSSPNARPYYLCAALSSERLSPVRGVLALSTWPLYRRIIGPLSPRTDLLTSTIRVAEHLERLTQAGDSPLGGLRLLTQMAQNIPGAIADYGPADPARVVAAARAELAVHQERDLRQRKDAAERAAARLEEVNQLFGSGLRTASTA
ncbi:hypothetical protein [Nonomuraea sp. SYSU D8015]|uniref:hypothetical protein n=1 Tax=Nonomuraea sp. SYSU D8015 TaxID=2593644 RepID=UPI0016601241|nr:hypothetical protein [Nonomuraea sp. SYSU D8015]